MDKNTELTIEQVAQIVYNLMYGKKRLNLLQAYSTVCSKYKTEYSYAEIKDYLFHHDLHPTDE
jgi:hypothetical protein